MHKKGSQEKEKGDKSAVGKKGHKIISEKDKEMALLAKALEEKTKEAASHYEQLLRVRAESENYRKRQAKEQSQFLKYSNESLIKSLLPVINNLERANEAAKTNNNVESLREGVEMILKMFYDVLKQVGVEPIQSANQSFDPSRHEVISCVESAEHEENTVIREFEKGYFLHDKLLCPARVIVTKKPAGSENKKPEGDTVIEEE